MEKKATESHKRGKLMETPEVDKVLWSIDFSVVYKPLQISGITKTWKKVRGLLTYN